MNQFNVVVWAVLFFGFFLDGRAYSADLTGVWTLHADFCNKVFVKRGNNISFAKDSDMYGSGFIIEGRRARGKTTNCTIKSTKEEVKEEGTMVHLVAACANDIMLSNVQVSFRIVDQNRIVRIYPGIPELQTTYERCLLK
jgi:hypothetical protein